MPYGYQKMKQEDPKKSHLPKLTIIVVHDCLFGCILVCMFVCEQFKIHDNGDSWLLIWMFVSVCVCLWTIRNSCKFMIDYYQEWICNA